ncbi:MAG: 50S ribosomal protein L4 [Planctomycetota bacterium]|nr:50S ribosomal protein L4 [Planctomycetota bacterium]
MKVQSYEAGKVGSAEFDTTQFGTQVLYRTLKDAVVMYHANQRQGTAKVKTRAEVHGSHKKPWKQKHTGRARAGDKKSPLWRKGGTIFGPHPRDFSYHMPRTAKRVALRSAIYGKLADGEVVLATLPRMDAPSAKTARKVLADLGAPRRALVLLGEANMNVWKSFRNFPGVTVKVAADLNARDVINGGTVIAERSALTALINRVGKDKTGGVA